MVRRNWIIMGEDLSGWEIRRTVLRIRRGRENAR
jgi:hypothetical protein